MARRNWFSLALLAAGLGMAVVLAIAFLPIFMGETWPALWGGEGRAQAYLEFGPIFAVSGWPGLLAVPISALLLLFFSALVAFGVILSLRRR
jgi:hypothetical protein